jgi:hypothetical protein
MKQSAVTSSIYFPGLVFILAVILAVIVYKYITRTPPGPEFPYKESLQKDRETGFFPFRYFQDSNSNLLPFVAVAGFFRDESAKQKYYEYVENGIHVFGITAYKSFPRIITDGTEGEYETNDDFDYTGNIKNWLCCFNRPQEYGFTENNNIIVMSESDFYDVTIEQNTVEKKYDFIYVCLKDEKPNCPINGWNAVNRNFKLAKKCFPIMIGEYGMNGLVVGRVGCGLENLYGDKLEITDMLDYHVLQEKMAQSRFLFVPNIFDASPRVISECITKNVPVLMNKDILCGSKYITSETGEFFENEYDLRSSLNRLLNKMDTISPATWWKKNYGTDIAEKKFRDFFNNAFPGSLTNIPNVKFVL